MSKQKGLLIKTNKCVLNVYQKRPFEVRLRETKCESKPA